MSSDDGAALCRQFPAAVALVEFGGLTVTVPVEQWRAAVTYARDALGTDYFDWLCGVDEGPTGFAVVTHLLAVPDRRHLLLRTVAPREQPRVDSLVGVFRGAGWHEREAWEMFGIVFEGHPNLTTLLLPDGFEGHPLRKDFVLAARAAKAWPGAREPGEESTRRAMQPPGQPAPDSGWPAPVATETKDPSP